MIIPLHLKTLQSSLHAQSVASHQWRSDDRKQFQRLRIDLGPVHTNAFSLSSKTHRSIRIYTNLLMRFHLFTLKRSKTIELYVAKATNTCAYDIFGHRFH